MEYTSGPGNFILVSHCANCMDRNAQTRCEQDVAHLNKTPKLGFTEVLAHDKKKIRL